MNALRFEAIDRLELVQIDPPVPGPDQVLIRSGAATICTSDLHDLHGNPFDITLPVILGHEGAGTIAALGTQGTGFAIGDRVAAHPVHPCLACETCASGMGHLCPNMSHFGLNMQGTFAEYFVARADRVRVLPNEVSFAAAALAEPVCVCLEALHQTGLGKGQRLLIIGDGPFGVIMARLAQRQGMHNVVLAGHHPARLAFAPTATTLNLRDVDDRKAALLHANDGHGFDATILTVGTPAAFSLALDVLRPKGRLVLFAPMPGETPVDLFKVLLNELEIVGSVNDPDLLNEAIEALADQALGIEDLITHRFPIEQYQQAFAMAEGDRDQAMKVAFVWDQD